MAEDKRTTPGAERPRRRRAAPTIDLTASEVPPPSPPPPEPQVTPEPDRPAAPPPPVSEAAKKSSPRSWTSLAAGVAGGIAVAEIAFALWLGFSARGSDAALTARLAALEAQHRVVASQPSSQPPAPPRDNLSVERLVAIENALKSLDAAIAASNKRSDEIATQIAALRERVDTVAKADDTAALQQRLAALETATKNAAQEAARNAGADAAGRLALAAAGLRDAVIRGEPFAPRLAAVRALGADERKLAPLEPFAAAGLPSQAALASQLRALLPRLVEAADASTDTKFLSRLQANAEKLVRIRPVDAPAGDDAAAILARIEVKAARQDVAGAQEELAKLPANIRAPADPWIKQVSARQTALAAAQALAEESAVALGKP